MCSWLPSSSCALGATRREKNALLFLRDVHLPGSHMTIITRSHQKIDAANALTDIWREGKEVINEKRSSKGGEEDGMVSKRERSCSGGVERRRAPGFGDDDGQWSLG